MTFLRKQFKETFIEKFQHEWSQTEKVRISVLKKKYKRCFWNRRNFFSVNNWKSFFMPLKRLSSYVQYAIIYTRRYLDISNEYKCANMQICWHAIHAMSDSCLHCKWKVSSILMSSRKRITLDSFSCPFWLYLVSIIWGKLLKFFLLMS